MIRIHLFLAFLLGIYAPELFSAHRIVRDNKITMKEARLLANQAKKNSNFPITVNDSVLKQLNRFLGKPSGREHMKVCFKRMKNFKPLISKRLSRHKLPQELLAVPLVESSYQNIHSREGWGSGLWMFVKPTAKSFGLKVNNKTDQRLNVKLSTEAALKYLKANHRLFKDWQLALLAYNMGEYRLKKAIKTSKTRNAWSLIKKGHHGDKEYLAKIMAVVIIMKNQHLIH